MFGDTDVESDEWIWLEIESFSGSGQVGTTQSDAPFKILNDDTAPVAPAAPTADDDGSYTVNVGETLTIAATTSLITATPDMLGLLTNDTLGFPVAAIDQFNIGSHFANAGDDLDWIGGGTLTVNADGSFNITNPGDAGTYTFEYRIANSEGNDTATVTIEVQEPPTVTDDSYAVNIGDTLTILTADSNDILDNDTVGTPAATISSFGGGSLGGSVTTNGAGDSVSLAGGTLTVNADGSFSLTNPSTTGNYSFNYRLENSVGADDGTINIEVTAIAPTATDDSGYLVEPGGTLNIATTDTNDLLDNDTLGSPVSTLTTFGGGDLSGDVTTNTAGDSVSLAGGTLTVNADGSFSLTNPTAAGSYSFDYQLSNSGGTSDGTVSILVGMPPVAMEDGVDDPATVENEELVVLSFDPNGQVKDFVGPVYTPFGGLLNNDSLGFPAASITSFGGGDLGGAVTDNAAGSSVTLAGGTLTVNSDGSITLVNATVPFGTHTFSYRLENAAGVSDAEVTLFISL